MKFSFACSEPSKMTDINDILCAYDDLMSCCMEISETQGNLDGVCAIMENINLSMEMIRVGGVEAVKLLNVDKSLEGLLGVAEEKLTVQAVQEGLGDAAKAVWEKIKLLNSSKYSIYKKLYLFPDCLGCITKTLLDSLNRWRNGSRRTLAKLMMKHSPM